MTPEDALAVLETLLQGQKLKEIQELVFLYSWQDRSYPEIAQATRYETGYIRAVGAELWQYLTQVFGVQVTKKNVRTIFRRQANLKRGLNALSPKGSKDSTPIKGQYWGERIDVTTFYGRNEELKQLRQSILMDRCNLITLAGIGGIGKTVLASRLSEQIQEEFDYLIWESLRNAPPLDRVLSNLIAVLSNQLQTISSGTLDAQISQLMAYLHTSRCLLIFDNVDSILASGDLSTSFPNSEARNYREGYEGYDVLLQRVAIECHSSCLLLTSREIPRTLIPLDGETSSVRIMMLEGLDIEEVREICADKGCSSSSASDWYHLKQHYSGNPLALKIAATIIRDIFDGSVPTFLEQGVILFEGISTLLAQQFDRLSELEQQVMYWLAIDREPISIVELLEEVIPTETRSQLLGALQALGRRSLIEKNRGRFTLQPVVMEYVTERLIETICQEIATQNLAVFISHALMKAQVKEYIRESQSCLILQPLVVRLMAQLGSKATLIEALNYLLVKLRTKHFLAVGYAGGNLIHLYHHLHVDLTGYNFSTLMIRQAYLQGMNLHHVNFADAKFTQCVFTQTFGAIYSVTFSPNGQCLATGDSMGKVWLWRVAEGQPLWTGIGHSQWVRCVAFSPDGSILASGSTDQTIKLWDAHTGQFLRSCIGNRGAVRSVAFCPNCQGLGENLPDGLLASGSFDQTIRLWDVHTGKLLKTLQGHTNMVKSVTFSPDGTRIASGSFDHTIKLWDVATGTLLYTLPGHDGVILTVTWSPDGTLIASCGGDHTNKIWDASTGELLRTLKGHTHWVISVQFSPDGQTLVSSSNDCTVRLWDTHTGQLLQTLQGHHHWVHGVAFSPDGQLIASGSDDQTVKLWNAQTGKLLSTLWGYTNSVLSVRWSPDGQILASSGADYQVNLWSTKTGELLRTLPGRVGAIAFSPDSQLIASGSDDQTAKLWLVEPGILLHTFEEHTQWVLSIEFSPDGALIATGSIDRTVRLWDVQTGELWKTFQGHRIFVWTVTFSQDGRYLASGDDHAAKLWDVQTGELLKTLEHPSAVLSVQLSQDGTMLVTGGADHVIRLWDLGKDCVLRTLQGHTDQVLSVALSPSGTLLASSSADQRVCVWDMDTGELLKTFLGHTDWVHSCLTDKTLRECNKD
jgi:WD40 repeat protein/SpoVK/Ycf46/Vps4 family AAA+-type ATPase